jgi:WD40 repeat protein
MPYARPILILSLIVCLVLAGCSAGPTPLPTLASSPTAAPSATATATSQPTATATAQPTATFTPTATALPRLPAALITPVLQPLKAITAEDALALRELARWGKGRAELAEYSPDGRWLVVKTAESSYVYPAEKPSSEQGITLEGNLIFASQGTAAATVSTSGRVELWQVEGWKRSAGWSGSQAAFSADGKLLAVAGSDAVLLVQASDGKEVKKLAFAGADRLIFNDTGSLLLAANRQSVQAWQVSDGKAVKTLDYERVTRLIFNASQSLVLVQARTEQNEAVIELYNPTDWTQVASLTVSGTLVLDSSQSRLFVFSNFPTLGKVDIFSLPDGKPEGSFRAGGSIYRLAVSPDGKTLAVSIVDFSASNQQTIGYLKTFDTKGKEIKRLDCGIYCEAQMPVFSPDSKYLAASGPSSANGIYTGSVVLFNPLSGERVRVLRGPKIVPGVVEKVAFAPDGNNLVTLTGRADDAVRVWKTADGALLSTLEWGADTLNLSELSAAGTLMATYSDAGVSRVQSVQNGATSVQVEKAAEPRFSPRGEWLATTDVNSGRAEGARLIKASNGESITAFPKTFGGPLFFSPAEDLGILLNNFSIQLVKLPGGGFAGTLNATGKPNVHLMVGAFSPDGKLIAAGSANGEVWVWRLADKKQLFILEGHKNGVTALVFSRDGSTLMTGSSDGAVNLWTVADGKLAKTVAANDLVRRFAATEDATFGQLAGLAQSPDGSLLAVSGYLNPLQPAPLRAGVTLVFNLADNSLLRVLPGGGGTPAFGAEGKLLLTSGDGAIHQWGLFP